MRLHSAVSWSMKDIDHEKSMPSSSMDAGSLTPVRGDLLAGLENPFASLSTQLILHKVFGSWLIKGRDRLARR